MYRLAYLGLSASLFSVTLAHEECSAFRIAYGNGPRFWAPLLGQRPSWGQKADAGTETRHELSCCSDEPAPHFESCAGGTVWANRDGQAFLDAKVALGYGDRRSTYTGQGRTNRHGGAMWWGGERAGPFAGCVSNVDWYTAKKICEAIEVNPVTKAKARLCTVNELDEGRCGTGTGCLHDWDYIWSDTRANNESSDCYKGRLPCCAGSPSSFLTRYDVCDGYQPGRADFAYCNQDMHQNDGNIQGCTNGRLGEEAGCQDPNQGLYACEVCPGCASHTGACPGPKQHVPCNPDCVTENHGDRTTW